MTTRCSRSELDRDVAHAEGWQGDAGAVVPDDAEGRVGGGDTSELGDDDALINETRRGLDVIRSGETLAGATRFAAGAGRHGVPES